jgi:hypothetical protein
MPYGPKDATESGEVTEVRFRNWAEVQAGALKVAVPFTEEQWRELEERRSRIRWDELKTMATGASARVTTRPGG